MRAPGPVRIFIVDDHAIIRSGLAAMLGRYPDLMLAGEATSGQSAIDLYPQVRPDVTLMDLALPGVDGWQAIARIRESQPNARFVAISTFAGDRDVQLAFQAGARGYLLKDADEEDIVGAIRAVHQGLRWVPQQVGEILASGAGFEPLSAREAQVLQLVAEGKSNKEIAVEFGVAESTIKGHMIHILSKLGVDDRTAAVTVAIARGVIRLPKRS
jgi:DNA-binding NarL/FixJ family response regulator